MIHTTVEVTFAQTTLGSLEALGLLLPAAQGFSRSWASGQRPPVPGNSGTSPGACWARSEP
jgi:hypothetical protein